MEAKELRIGNYVKSTLSGFRGKPLKIFGIENENIVYLAHKDYRTRIDYLKPIPLTEELLIRFGFENEIDEMSFFDGDICIYWRKHNKYLQIEGNKYFIKYIHQLQNLYFAITQKELCLDA